MNACISAIQHLRPLRGGSQAQLLRASDGNCYVTKFKNNPQHLRVLANEMLATRLGLLLGFESVKWAEIIEKRGDKCCRPLHSPLWQADSDKIRRMAPVEFIGRYMPGWFDYAICDEVHQLAGDTAQGNALGTLAACAKRIVGLTGTLLGGFADDLFNTLFRLEAGRMKEHGYEWGTSGRGAFTQDYGVLETITKIEPADNRCSKAKTTSTVRRKPGASPLLFGEFLMQLCAFVFLEDISDELPPYEESYLSVPMDEDMREAYRELEDDIREALKKHRGNRSVLSTMLNTLLVYPDHPYGLGTLYGSEFDGELKRNVRFVIADTRDLPHDRLYSKERRLIQEIKLELAQGRRCQVFAVYTHKHDVTARLQKILSDEGIRSATGSWIARCHHKQKQSIRHLYPARCYSFADLQKYFHQAVQVRLFRHADLVGTEQRVTTTWFCRKLVFMRSRARVTGTSIESRNGRLLLSSFDDCAGAATFPACPSCCIISHLLAQVQQVGSE